MDQNLKSTMIAGRLLVQIPTTIIPMKKAKAKAESQS